MAFTTKLELRQSHSLVMTPQLQQAIKLLQLSNVELASFVETELERNPLLEREESDESGVSLATEPPEPFAAEVKEEMNGHAVDGAEQSDGDAGNSDEGEWLDLQSDDRSSQPDELDTDPQDVFPESEGYGAGAPKDSNWGTLGQGPRLDGDEAPNLEAYVAEERTLKDHLSEQLMLAVSDPAKRAATLDPIDALRHE